MPQLFPVFSVDTIDLIGTQDYWAPILEEGMESVRLESCDVLPNPTKVASGSISGLSSRRNRLSPLPTGKTLVAELPVKSADARRSSSSRISGGCCTGKTTDTQFADVTSFSTSHPAYFLFKFPSDNTGAHMLGACGQARSVRPC